MEIHLYVAFLFTKEAAGPRTAVGSTSDSRGRGAGFDIRSGHILSFLLSLIQEGQLSVTGESMCNHLGGLNLSRKSVVSTISRHCNWMWRGHISLVSFCECKC